MDPLRSALLTDLYELTMLQAYHDEGMNEEAVFEFFIRDLPPDWGFLLVGGLEQALDYLEGFRFTESELAYLAETRRFNDGFLDRLRTFRFTGDVHAMPEGSIAFPDEPLVRVTAPLPEAQFVESRLMNLLHYQTLIASKAARMVLAAEGRLLVDFGFRRAHGAEAGLLAARAAYLAGFTGTATVAAGTTFGVPTFGTMAHAYVQAHDREEEAFLNFARAQPENVVLLLDTYDTEAAARKVASLARRLREQGSPVKAVRIDSGDLAAHARAVRAILDEAGEHGIGVFASGNLDEHRIRDLLAAGAPITGFGAGTRLTTSADRPYLDSAYKLQAYAGRPRRKRSEGKATWPGAKQVYRRFDEDGRMAGDVLTVEGDPQEGSPLLEPVMRAGARVGPRTPLQEARARAADALACLPPGVKRLAEPAAYPVDVSPALRELAARVDASLA